MSKIPILTEPCVLFPLRREASSFLKRGNFDLFPIHKTELISPPCPAWLAISETHSFGMLETGVGADVVASALDWLLHRHRPRFVLLAGFAGGLSPSLSMGDVVLVSECLDEAGETLAMTWPSNAIADTTFRRGRLLTTSQTIATVEAKRALAERHNAVLVDMEAMHAAKFCREHGIPFGCLRVVLDDASSPLSPHLIDMLAGGRVRPFRLLTGLVRRPWLLAELCRLARQSKAAGIRLAEGLMALSMMECWGK